MEWTDEEKIALAAGMGCICALVLFGYIAVLERELHRSSVALAAVSARNRRLVREAVVGAKDQTDVV